MNLPRGRLEYHAYVPIQSRRSVLMPNANYPRDRTAYLLVDPYNDFLSEGGKVFALVEPIAALDSDS